MAIGAVCNMLLHPWGAMLTGVASGVISAYGFTFFIPFFAELGIRDFCGIMGEEGGGGGGGAAALV